MSRAARAALASIALIGAMALASGSAAAKSKGVTGPGCNPARFAVAHRAGGVALKPQPTGAPTSCMTFTGPTTDSAAIGVTGTGKRVALTSGDFSCYRVSALSAAPAYSSTARQQYHATTVRYGRNRLPSGSSSRAVGIGTFQASP